jgi:hypothetical protein
MACKIAAALLTGLVLAELGWHWYSDTVMMFEAQLSLLAQIVLMVGSWGLVVLNVDEYNADN